MGASRLGAALLTFVLLGAVGSTPRAHAGEVVESFDDGSPKAKYQTNEQGQKEGRYTAFHPNGKVALETTYRAGELDGAYVASFESGKVHIRATYKAGKKVGHYEEYGDDGELALSSNYADDRLHGRLEVFRSKKAVSNQTWRNGELVTLEGVAASPLSIDAIRKTVASILAGAVVPAPSVKGKAKASTRKPEPRASEPPVEGDVGEQRRTALRLLQAYRFVCGVPYEDLRLGESPNAYAQAAAEISAKLGRIDHEPPNPGLSDEQYRFAAKGAASCNLDPQDAISSVDAYFDDSDPSNMKRVGHRRWCLNPAMVVTGFGVAKGSKESFSAMWAMDESRAPIPDYEAVCYPARGFMPVDLFGADRVWSVSPNPTKFPNVPKEGVEVRVYRLGADFVRSEAPLQLDLQTVDSSVGSGPCVIFRPKGVEVVDGAAYWVEIAGLDAKPKKPGERPKKSFEPSLRYLVRFCAPVLPARPEAPPDAPPDDPSDESK